MKIIKENGKNLGGYMNKENLIFEINSYLQNPKVKYKRKLDLILSCIKKEDEKEFWIELWKKYYNEWKEKKNTKELDAMVKCYNDFYKVLKNLEKKKKKEMVSIKENTLDEYEIFN
jgi:hypothetical protein